MSYREGKLQCDMKDDCHEAVTHIDEKGFAYCDAHGKSRKTYMRCRKLTKTELKQLENGQPLKRY